MGTSASKGVLFMARSLEHHQHIKIQMLPGLVDELLLIPMTWFLVSQETEGEASAGVESSFCLKVDCLLAKC